MSEHMPFVRRNFWAVLQIPRQTPHPALIPACDDSGVNAGFSYPRRNDCYNDGRVRRDQIADSILTASPEPQRDDDCQASD
jgi:hypothetical protein